MAGKKRNDKRREPEYTPEERRHLEALGQAVKSVREERSRMANARVASSRIADEADVHRNTMGRLERGQVSPGFTKLVQIAAALDVSMSDLMAAYEEKLGDNRKSER